MMIRNTLGRFLGSVAAVVAVSLLAGCPGTTGSGNGDGSTSNGNANAPVNENSGEQNENQNEAPTNTNSGTLTGDAAAGQVLFTATGCSACHDATTGIGGLVAMDADLTGFTDADSVRAAMMEVMTPNHTADGGFLSTLSDQDLADFGAFFESLTP